MSRFLSIARIRLEHDYYTPPINRHLRLIPTPHTYELMKQRGVIYRQATFNEWQWLVDENNAGFLENDIFVVSLIVDDPVFIRKVSVKEDYDPNQLYQIRLGSDHVVEFNSSLKSNEKKRQGEFCRIEWLPIKPEQIYTIRFSTCSYFWEFLLVFKDKTDQVDLDDKYYVLETNSPSKPYVFRTSEKYKDNLFDDVDRIVSEVKIEAKEHYDFTLILYECSSGNNKRRVISKFIPIPQLGKYVASTETLREVCYL